MMTNRKALQRRMIRLERAVLMRDRANARVHVIYTPGYWPPHATAENTPDLAAAERDALAAYETEHGSIGPHDTTIHVTFVQSDRSRTPTSPPEETSNGSTPAPHDADENAPCGKGHAPAPTTSAPASPPPHGSNANPPERNPFRDLGKYF